MRVSRLEYEFSNWQSYSIIQAKTITHKVNKKGVIILE